MARIREGLTWLRSRRATTNQFKRQFSEMLLMGLLSKGYAEGSDLIPADAYDRARMFEWLFWEHYSHEPYVAVVRFQVAFLGKSPAEGEERLVQRGYAAIQRIEDGLAASPFLTGERLSLADVACVAYTRVAPEGGFDLAGYPVVRDWIGRVEDELHIA